MFRLIDAIAKRIVAYPLVFAAFWMTNISGWMLRFSAALLDIPVSEDDGEQ